MKKFIISAVTTTMLTTGVALPYANAQKKPQLVSMDESTPNVNVNEIAKAKEITDIIKDLDKKLNMYDLSKNKKSDIDKLDKEEQEFYYLFKRASENANGKLTQEDTLKLLNSYYQNNVKQSENKSLVSAASVIKKRDWKLSNSQVNNIVTLVNLHGTGWGLMIALAKAFAKSPTLLTMLIVAVPALGGAALARCNKKGKGIIISDLQVGATHSFSCRSR
ncbi:hypothetical protein [Bacillus sp. FSL R5-0434]|uniref:hypothetical protein n=1 Tax=Bacillus sp. FSL R5-0434 TaxID=2975301 RepID=UPI0030F5786D